MKGRRSIPAALLALLELVCGYSGEIHAWLTLGKPHQRPQSAGPPAPLMLFVAMTCDPSDLLMVDAHIAQGERHVLRQREIVVWLRSRGHPTEMAERLLGQFQSTLEQHRAHRRRMLDPDQIIF